nr:hypothetical protein [Tanacetum cinerariifolium]
MGIVPTEMELILEHTQQGAHYGYNCPLKVPVVSNPEPCHNPNVDELPQTLPGFDPTGYSRDENSFTYDSQSNIVDVSPNVFNPPSQPPVYSSEFYGKDAHYGHYCTPQVPFIYPEPCYNQDFNFPHVFMIFNNNIFVVKIAGVLMKPTNEEEKQIEEEQATKAQYWKILVCYDDDNDDDEDYTIAITPILLTK